MLASRLFWKIFAAYALLTLVSATILVGVLSSRQETIVVDRVEQRLHDSAVLLRDAMGDVFDADSDTGAKPQMGENLKQLGKETGTRLTLVDAEGKVLGDSVEDPAVMENHRNREELLEARNSGYGLAQRPSPTLGVPMMYVALRVGEAASPKGFVRVSTTMESVQEQVRSVQRLIIVTAILVSLMALSGTYLILGRMIRPLETLTDAAISIADGEVQQHVDVVGSDELATLARAFNQMSQQLAARIEELYKQGDESAANSERLEAVLDGMIEGVLAIDRDERILFANPAVQNLLEFAPSDVIGRPMSEAVRIQQLQELVRQSLEAESEASTEMELTRTQSIVEVTATRLSGDPCPGVILVLHDVSELRRLENIRQQFVSNVSHELKTPLTSIQAYTETLLNGAIEDAEHNREFLKRIDEQADRLHTLILDLLRLARIESGADTFARTPVGLDPVIRSCIDAHRTVANTKQVRLRTAEEGAGLTVLADEEGLRTILDNLVDNAIKYTPAGGEVEIRCRRQGPMAVLDVKDTGVGIAAEHRDRIFERFYRVDRARSREMGGTGLGLSIVKHLALVFGGSVEVASELEKGTTFSVQIPLAS